MVNSGDEQSLHFVFPFGVPFCSTLLVVGNGKDCVAHTKNMQSQNHPLSVSDKIRVLYVVIVKLFEYLSVWLQPPISLFFGIEMKVHHILHHVNHFLVSNDLSCGCVV
jgi:hypothetical protein